MENVTIAIDAMGGDYGLNVTVPASWQILKRHRNVHLILVGDEEQLKAKLGTRKLRNKRLSIKHSSEKVEMDELPSRALRNKKDSSMRVATNLVKDGIAQACVSSGNTGALMATAKFVLKTLPGVDRPAIIYALPTMTTDKEVRMLDLGANVDSCADHLYQFAIMGSVVTTAMSGIKKPKVALLNIGEEEIKGNDLVKHTAQLLSDSEHINYMGYIEGNDIFKGEADVVVCDGFVGNVSLKTMEGMAKLIGFHTKREFKKNWYSQLAAFMIIPILRRLKKALDPDSRNGASFIGLQGIVIKSHGGANQKAFVSAVQEAILEVEKNVPQHIGEEVGELLEEAEFI